MRDLSLSRYEHLSINISKKSSPTISTKKKKKKSRSKKKEDGKETCVTRNEPRRV